MKQPTSSTRFLGTPRIANTICLGSALCVLFWLGGGGVPWWVAIISLFIASAGRKASAEVKRYDAWAKEWNAIAGGFSQAAPPPRQRGPAGKPKVHISRSVAVAALLWLSIPVAAPSVTPSSGKALTLLWCFVSLFLLWKVLTMVYRAVLRPKTRTGTTGRMKQKAQGPDVVEWVLPRASSSPSRAEAMRNLPEYSARLMGIRAEEYLKANVG